MHELILWGQAHPIISGLAAFHLFSNLVGAMDKPDEKSSLGYRYVYRVSHGLAGNLQYALKAKFPAMIPDKPPE